MANAYVNKVVQSDGTVLIDISDATATADKILEGYTAYGATGEKLTGTATGGAVLIQDTIDTAGGTITTITATNQVHIQNNKRVTPTSTDQTITPDTGYDALGSVIVEGVTNQGYTIDDIMNASYTGNIVINAQQIQGGAFYNSQVASIYAPNALKISHGAAKTCTFMNCNNLTSFIGPNIGFLSDDGFKNDVNLTTLQIPDMTLIDDSLCYNCSSLNSIVLKIISNIIYTSAFFGCSSLKGIDFYAPRFMRNYVFKNCTVLDTIIFRYPYEVRPLSYTAIFDGTPFASGGTGGTIYIPQNLYNHLGDGSSLDYKSATNWSSIDGYGTITWVKLEGSQYENYYYDGTSIASDNLIDFNNLSDGIKMPDNITVTTGTLYATDFISLQNITKLYSNVTRKTANGNNSIARIYYYDSNQNYLNKIDTYDLAKDADIFAGMYHFFPPNDAAYCRLVFHVDYDDIAYLGISGSGK